MTKQADFSNKVDNLLALTAGGDDDVIKALLTKQGKTQDLPLGIPKESSFLALYNAIDQNTEDNVKVTLNQLKTLFENDNDGTPVTWKIGSDTGPSGILNTLILGEGLIANAEPNGKTVELTVPSTISREFLSILNKQIPIWGNNNTPHERTAVWFGEPITLASPYVFGNNLKKTVTVSPNVGVDSETYLVVFRVAVQDKAISDCVIRLEVRERTGVKIDYALDKNGNPLVIEKAYKTNDEYGTLLLVGLMNIKATAELSFHITTTAISEPILETPGKNTSAILIQAADTLPTALQIYETTTRDTISIAKYDYMDDISNIKNILNYPMPLTNYKTDITVNSNIFKEENFILLLVKGSINAEITDNQEMIFTDVTADGFDIPFFYFVSYCYFKETEILKGKNVISNITIQPAPLNSVTVALMIVYYNGVEDDYTNIPNIIDNISEGAPVFNEGWKTLDKEYMTPNTNNIRNGTVNGIVPDDAKLLAFIVMPSESIKPMYISLKEWEIKADPGFREMDVIYVQPKDEKFLIESTQFAKSVVKIPDGQTDVTIPIPTGPYAINFGVLEKNVSHIPVYITKDGALSCKESIADIDLNVNIVISALPAIGEAPVNLVMEWVRVRSGVDNVIPSQGQMTWAVDKTWINRNIYVDLFTDMNANDIIFLTIKADRDNVIVMRTDQIHIPVIELVISKKIFTG